MRAVWRTNPRLQHAKSVVAFGGELPERHGDLEQYECFYAFAVADRVRPRVFTYNTDQDGIESLANLVRSEEVLSIVRGREVTFAELSVVEMQVAGRKFRHRMPVKEQRW